MGRGSVMSIFRQGIPVVPRGEKRLPAFDPVEILTDGGDLVARATLRDISGSGALLRLENTKAVPGRIQLRLPMLGIRAGAAVRWRSEKEIGLRFDVLFDLEPLLKSKRNRVETAALNFWRVRI